MFTSWSPRSNKSCMALRRDRIMSGKGEISLAFRLTGWSAWSRGCETLAEWNAWAGMPETAMVESGLYAAPGSLSSLLRRRTTKVGRAGLAAAMGLANAADARYIFSTRHGEFEHTVSILESLMEHELPSPAKFSMSVHNALSGLLSIDLRNTKGHSAIAAGPESFCYGMMEAVACLVERPEEPVILVHFDELPGGGFADLLPEEERETSIVVALGLASSAMDGGELMTMTAEARNNGDRSAHHALDFIRFLLTGVSDASSAGNRMSWRWIRA